ncbi:unnamed protein product [Caenorhabditis auriculariae]|uniref:UPAR/Ly6 domain-containing protein n=1 Tax=Caenorhabditis auriculariae TaxID=2777116 RepID=A0A8S1HRX7_9PELO|nr:unnamed protein product [Caenorhabditis auriculariae]
MLILLFFLPYASPLVDCVHGFVGRMQPGLNDNFFHINDTSMCSAMYCIKVFVNSAIDDDNLFQQGVSSRCAYTGGDREVCLKATGCQDITFYDGMRGNFSFCCCQENNCNQVGETELEELYQRNSKSKRSRTSSSSSFSTVLYISFAFIFRLVY